MLWGVYKITQKIFQSTLPQGERLEAGANEVPEPKISIHAPARGATFNAEMVRAILDDFNPRSRKGSDGGISYHCKSKGEFQSTLPQGERRHRTCSNSIFRLISIHAPARGATFNAEMVRAILDDFNPRSRKGSDSKNTQFSTSLGIPAFSTNN